MTNTGNAAYDAITAYATANGITTLNLLLDMSAGNHDDVLVDGALRAYFNATGYDATDDAIDDLIEMDDDLNGRM